MCAPGARAIRPRRTPEAADLLVEGGSLLIDLIRHAAVAPPAPEATADFVARVGRLLEAPAAGSPTAARRIAGKATGAVPTDAA